MITESTLKDKMALGISLSLPIINYEMKVRWPLCFISSYAITNEEQYKKLDTENTGRKDDTTQGKPYHAIAN